MREHLLISFSFLDHLRSLARKVAINTHEAISRNRDSSPNDSDDHKFAERLGQLRHRNPLNPKYFQPQLDKQR